MITTVHNLTGTQPMVDMPNAKKKDLRRCRSGMLNLAPTTTGSATAVAEVRTRPEGVRSRGRGSRGSSSSANRWSALNTSFHASLP